MSETGEVCAMSVFDRELKEMAGHCMAKLNELSTRCVKLGVQMTVDTMDISTFTSPRQEILYTVRLERVERVA